MLDANVAADQRWRDAFASTANSLLQAGAGGPRVLYADFSTTTPWVACAAGDGPGAEQVFIALGQEYRPNPAGANQPDPNRAGGEQPDTNGADANGAGSPGAAAAGDTSFLQWPTVGLQPVSSPPPTSPSQSAPVSPASSPVSPSPVSPPPASTSPVSPSPVSPPPVSPPPASPIFPPLSSEAATAPEPTSGGPEPVSSPPPSLGVGAPSATDLPPSPAADPLRPVVDPAQQAQAPPLYFPEYPPLRPSDPDLPRRRTGLWIAVAVGVVLALVAGASVYAWQSDGGTPVAASSGTPVASASPTPSDNRPSEHNTGVPKDAELRVVEGDRTFGKNGQIYSGLDLRGNVRITGDNIILRRSIIRGVGRMNGDQCTSAAVIWIDGGTNVTIQDVEVYGAQPNACLDGIWAENATLSRVNIHDVVDGVKAYDNVTIHHSYIHDLAHFDSSPIHDGGPSHNDGVQSWEGNHDITLRQNTIKLTPQDNAAFMVNQSRGKRATNIDVRDNWLDGGWCTLNFSQGNGPTPMTGISVRNNRFGRTSSCPIHLSAAVTLSANYGNVWDGTDEPIPPPQRPSR
jgi:hypothetical protein